MSSYSLELPYIASIPYKVQIHETLSFAAKLYFGQIVPLAHKYGYMFATDEQLSKMKGVSTRTIQRYHQELEDAGFIYRDTCNYPLKGEDGKFSWVKKRRIYITDAFTLPDEVLARKNNSKKVTDTDTSGGSLEHDTSGDIKIAYSIKHLDKQPVAPKEVVIFSCLEKLEEVSPYNLEKVCEEYSESDVHLAVTRCLGWHSRPNDTVGLLTALSRKDSWMDNLTPEQKIDKNIEFLKKYQKLDGTKISSTTITVGSKYIEFSAGMKIVVYSVEDDDLKTKTVEYLEYLHGCEDEEKKGHSRKE